MSEAGYGRPPTATRFKPGQSGNPRGRPRNRHQEIPHDTVLGQMVTIIEAGRKRRVTAAEAFVLKLIQQGLAGDSSATRCGLEALEKARARRPTLHQGTTVIVVQFIAAGIETIMGSLGIASKLYPTDKSRVRWKLQPWIVEAALDRLGERRLSAAEQREVWANVQTPHKVRWPGWWTVKG